MTYEIKITLILIIIIAASCGIAKKDINSTTSSTSTTTETMSANSLSFLKPADEIHAPGNEELSAIQAQYKDVTLDKLKQGYSIYTEGACISCHGAKNIYQFTEVQWKGIIEDMAQRATISDVEKDAVYKYVLAIKAMQPK
ncbi:MAG: hypothetical protein ACXVPU_10035 [Bacteroidia bacterium]